MLACVVSLVASFAAYAPSLSGELIWDDFYLVGENPFFRSPIFGCEVFRHYLFLDSFSTYYRPIQNWSYIWDYWLWRGDPTGYHVTNVLLHGGSGFLLYLLLRRILPPLLGKDASHSSRNASALAFTVALAWVIHPVHNAAVAYISGRADSLAACFALAAWVAALSVRSATSSGGKWTAAALAALSSLLALCSKEIALIWLVLFLMHAAIFDKTWTRRAKVVALAAALTVLAGYAILRGLPERRIPITAASLAPISARGLLALRALGDYSSLLIFPAELHMERSLETATIYQNVSAWRLQSRAEWLSIIGLLTIVGVGRLCWWKGTARPLRCFGATWFVLAFLPISNLFPLNAQAAEHWIYLASMGAFIFLAGCVAPLFRLQQPLACSVAALAIMSWGARTFVRSGDWVNEETFFARTIAAGAGTPRVLGSLAAIYARRGDLTNQESLLRKTITLFPDFTPARINLGICLRRQGRTDEANDLLDLGTGSSVTAAQQYPRTWSAALNLAKIRKDEGQTEAALEILRAARGRFPENWDLIRYETTLLREHSTPQQAATLVEAYASARWWHVDSRLTLADCRRAMGDPDGALNTLREAARLDLYDTRPAAASVQIELQRGRPQQALAAQLEAVKRDPNQPRLYYGLAEILSKLGRDTEARGATRRAETLVAEARRL